VPLLLLHSDSHLFVDSEGEAPSQPTFEERFHPGIEILEDDLSQLSESQIRARDLTPLATFALLCYRFLLDIPSREAIDHVTRWGDLLQTAAGEGGQPASAAVVSAIACHCADYCGLEGSELRAIAEEILLAPHRPIEAVPARWMSTADTLRLQGYIDGFRVGSASALLLEVLNK
jgi:hypothetical protein